MKRMFAATAGTLLLVAGAQAQPAKPLIPVTVAEVSPIAVSWTSFAAEAKGFYTENGIKVAVNYTGGTPETVQQLIGGAVDFAQTSFDTAMRSVASGADLSVVGCVAIKYPFSIMVDPVVKTAQDLKGKTIALPFKKDASAVIWNHWLKDQGMQPTDVDQVYGGASPGRYAALSSHSIAAAMLGPPLDLRAAGDGFKKLLDLGAYAKGHAFLVYMARRPWLKEHGDAARAFLRAEAKAVDWLYDPANKEEAIDLLLRNAKQERKVAEQTYAYYIEELKPFSHNLDLPDGYIQYETRALMELGDISSPDAVPKTFVDLQYLPK